MAEERVDGLVITSRFDEAGLDQSTQQQLAILKRFANQVNTLGKLDPLKIDISGFVAEFGKAGGDVAQFFAAFSEGAEGAVSDLQRVQHAASNIPPPRGFIEATRESQRLAQANLAATRSVDQVAAAMGRATAGVNAWAQGLARINAANRSVNASSALVGQGANRVRAGLQTIAIQASGVPPAIGTVVSGLLLLGPGSVAVLAVAAGMAVIGTALNAFNAPAKKAREEAEKLAETFRSARLNRLPMLEQLSLQMVDTQTKIRETSERIIALQVQSSQSIVQRFLNSDNIRDELALLKEFKLGMTELGVAMDQARFKAGNELVRGLATQAATFGQTALAAQRLAVTLDQGLSKAQKAAALGLIDFLEKMERQKKALEESKKRAEELNKTLLKVGITGEALPTLALQADKTAFKPRVDFSEVLSGLEEVRRQTQRAIGDDGMQKELNRAADAAKTLGELLHGIGLELKDIGDASILSDQDQINQLNQLLDGFRDVAQAFNQFGQDTGLLNENDIRALQTFQDAAKSIASFASGDIVGGIVSGLSALGGIFGESEADREDRRLRQQNNDQLERLRNEMSRLTTSLSNLVRAEQASGGIDLDTVRIAQELQNVPGGGLETGLALIDREVRKFGLTLEQLDAIAEANGLDLVADNGRLVTDAFVVLNEVLGITIDRLTKFDPTSLTESLRLAGLDARIAGQDFTGSDAFQAAIDALTNIPGTLEQRFEGVDFTNEEAVRAALDKLAKDFREGRITEGEFGDLTKEDVFRLLELGADALDEFTKSVEDATKSTLNLPSGFKLALAEFNALDPQATFRPVNGPFLPVRGTDGAAQPIPQNTVTVGDVTISVVAAPGQTPEDTADAVMRAFRRKAMLQSGDTMDFRFS